MIEIIIIVSTIFLMILIWFVFFAKNDLEDDGLSSIVNFEMPKLFGEGGAKKGFFRKRGFVDESENVKSLRGEMLGKKQVVSSLEQELGDVQDIRFAREVARRGLEDKRIKCMNMVDEVLELQDKLGIPPDESFDDNIENMDSATLDLRMTELSHVLRLLRREVDHQDSEKMKERLRRKQDEVTEKRILQEKERLELEENILKDKLKKMKDEEALIYNIENAKSIEELEGIKITAKDEKELEKLNKLIEENRIRILKEELELSELEKFEELNELIYTVESVSELELVKIEGVNTKQEEDLKASFEERHKLLTGRETLVKQLKRYEELIEEIEGFEALDDFDTLVITGVNQRQEKEIKQIKKMRRMIVANKIFEETILNASSVEELNELIITGVSEENEFELIKLRNERINDIEDEVQSAAVEKYSNLISEATGVLELDGLIFEDVEGEKLDVLNELRDAQRASLVAKIREEEYRINYQKLRDEIKSIEEIEELLGFEIHSVGEEYTIELEKIRLGRFEFLEEQERLRVENEELERYNSLRGKIQHAKTSEEIEGIIIEDVNEEQEEELTNLKDEMFVILKEEESIRTHVENALTTESLEPIEYNGDLENVFLTRFGGFGAKIGDVQISLIWENNNDLDLIVRTPNDELIHRARKTSSCNGVLDLEMNMKPESKAPLENIVWEGISAGGGKYDVFVWHRKRHGMLRGKDPTKFTIRVANGSNEVIFLSGQTSFGDPMKFISKIDVGGLDVRAKEIQAKEGEYLAAKEKIEGAESVEELEGVLIDQLSRVRYNELFALKEEWRVLLERKEEEGRILSENKHAEELLEKINNGSLDDLRKLLIEGVNEEKVVFLEELLKDKISDLEMEFERKRRVGVANDRMLGALGEAEKVGPLDMIEEDERRDKDFDKRLHKAGGGDGDLKISLIWDNFNDLDLIVTTPGKEILHSGSRETSCGGLLDIDMNFKPESRAPIENVFWGEGKAKEGEYKVFVHHFKKHNKRKTQDPTEFRLQMKVGDRRGEFMGQLSSGDPVVFVGTMNYNKK
jgi:hypothetical protein